MRVLMMLKEGLLNKQIAFQLGISEATIKAHVSAILQSSLSAAAPRLSSRRTASMARATCQAAN